MTLQVIGAGLGRTGTTSLKQALEQLLGGPCYHMLEVQGRTTDADSWGDAYEGRPPAWDNFFEGYQATVDWPAAPFWAELSRTFPDGLILLSVRDPDAWWKSASSTIFPALETYFAPDAASRRLDPNGTRDDDDLLVWMAGRSIGQVGLSRPQ